VICELSEGPTYDPCSYVSLGSKHSQMHREMQSESIGNMSQLEYCRPALALCLWHYVDVIIGKDEGSRLLARRQLEAVITEKAFLSGISLGNVQAASSSTLARPRKLLKTNALPVQLPVN
jgi:hypothetical protein